MAKHRAEPPPRVRPRLGRIAGAALALSITTIALLNGVGVLNLDAGSVSPAGAAAQVRPASTPTAAPAAPGSVAPKAAARQQLPAPPATRRVAAVEDLPADSGSGRRVVFSIDEQRVWLVDARNRPVSTYLVSGSLTDNLKPGTYDVYSRSRWAVGIDDSGVMQYFVRFTRGKNAPIGFHSIPTKNGEPLQTEEQLGTPQSHGCIRQRKADAERLWNFAPIGTEVVVV